MIATPVRCAHGGMEANAKELNKWMPDRLIRPNPLFLCSKQAEKWTPTDYFTRRFAEIKSETVPSNTTDPFGESTGSPKEPTKNAVDHLCVSEENQRNQVCFVDNLEQDGLSVGICFRSRKAKRLSEKLAIHGKLASKQISHEIRRVSKKLRKGA
jgi:hypothetical protein